MTVRAYFLLDDPFSGGEVVNEPALVPVLRTVPESSATARAAMKALLAGPSAKERAAFPRIETLIPAGSKLLGIEISRGTATVDLSAEFATLSPADAWDLGVFSLRGRLAQVVYTLTQFTAVDRVSFKLEGKPVRELLGMANPEDGSPEAIALDRPVTRATYRDRYLPMIFVDRPAWGAALPNPGRGYRPRQRLRGPVSDRPARSQRKGPRRCAGPGDLRHRVLGSVRRDAVVRRFEGAVGNPARLGCLGVQRQAGSGAGVPGLSQAGTLKRTGSRPRIRPGWRLDNHA